MTIVTNLGGLTSAGISLSNGVNNFSNPNGSGAFDTVNGLAGAVQSLTKPGSPLSIATGVTAGYSSLFGLGQAISDFNNAPSGSDAATSAALGVAAALGGFLSTIPHPATKGIGLALNIGATAAKIAWDNGWRPFGHPDYDPLKPAPECDVPLPIGDRNRNGIPDIHESIDPKTKAANDAAKNWFPRHDPLTLDLDNDGLETTAIAATNPILFDHDGDGIKNGTGWVSSDDGFLVRDKNGNGSIDSGRELFGDSTIKSNGQLATDGFDALADLDSISNGGNADGRISNADAQFANLRVWRDLNQDGISQSNELFTLSSQNIASINVTKTANSQTLANGNQIADLGSFTRTDGSTGTAGAVTRFNLYTQINDAEWRIVA